MRVFMDMEFSGLTQRAMPISIAFVSDDDRFFYAEFNDFKVDKLNEWVRENVVSCLVLNSFDTFHMDSDGTFIGKGGRKSMTKRLRKWLEQFDRVDICGDVSAYDWVLFCELFGGSLGLPSNVYYIPLDFATMLHAHGIDPDVDRVEFAGASERIEVIRGMLGTGVNHNALIDAVVLAVCWDKLEHVYNL